MEAQFGRGILPAKEYLSNVLSDALEEAAEPFCFQMQEKEMQKMTQLLLELKREQEEKEAFWEKMSMDLIEKICILILRKSPKKRRAKEEIPEAVRRALVFVRQHFGKNMVFRRARWCVTVEI